MTVAAASYIGQLTETPKYKPGEATRLKVLLAAARDAADGYITLDELREIVERAA